MTSQKGQTQKQAVTFVGWSRSTFTLDKWRRAYSPDRASPLRWLYLFLFYYQPGLDRKAVMEWICSPYRTDAWLSVHARVSLFFVLAFALTTWLAVGFMAFIYRVNWSCFEKYRINPTPWPWHTDASNKEYKPYMALVKSTWDKLKSAQIFVSGVMFLCLHWYSSNNATDAGFQEWIDSTPHWTTSLWQCMVGFFLFDTCFFCGHWFLHHSSAYKWHKQHHEYKRPMCLTGQHGTLADGLIAAIIPGIALTYLIDMHIYTGVMFTIASMFQSVDDHCGYDFPFTPLCLIPFAGFTTEHDWHHTGNKGNYGLYFTHWDTLFGTDKLFLEHQDKRQAQLQKEE